MSYAIKFPAANFSFTNQKDNSTVLKVHNRRHIAQALNSSTLWPYTSGENHNAPLVNTRQFILKPQHQTSTMDEIQI